VSILVTDQGEGIEPENIDRVFERFYRVDNARTREEGGTGLGLSIVRHTMLTHGGSVSVWSKPGVGSTFTLRFPRLGSDLTTDKILINKKKKRKHKK
jgi:two-component system sensor histidine kinase SenX3